VDKARAIDEIKRVFRRFRRLTRKEDRWLQKVTIGKVYELYCLSKTLGELRNTYGYQVQFRGRSIRFQASPGAINRSMPHFSILDNHGRVYFELFTDVEFITLGHNLSTSAADLSAHHEIDLLVVDAGASGRPSHDQVVLGVECKAHVVFKKSIVKEVLGMRREMSMLKPPSRSQLAQSAPSGRFVDVPADPASEYWLACADQRVMQYARSPFMFGISFLHWEP
jgi:hypothetical protein